MFVRYTTTPTTYKTSEEPSKRRLDSEGLNSLVKKPRKPILMAMWRMREIMGGELYRCARCASRAMRKASVGGVDDLRYVSCVRNWRGN